MRILGINISHNASICQLTNGKIDFFFEEDRFNKVKNLLPKDFRKLIKKLPLRIAQGNDITEKRFASADNIMTSGIRYVDDVDQNFIQRNPWTTGVGAAAASKLTKTDPLKYGRKIPRKILSSLLTPTGALAAWPLAAMGSEKITGEEVDAFDPKSGIDRAAAGAELAFAPSLVKWTDKLTKPIKNPAVRAKVGQLLNLGMKPAMAMRIARLASPIGWASLGLEGLYQGGKFMYKDYQRRKADIEAAKADPNYVNPKYDTNFEVYAGGGRAGYMGGGITGIRRPSAIAPTGGPMSQGLRSLYINDRDY